jgi:YD repeat-containing protein
LWRRKIGRLPRPVQVNLTYDSAGVFHAITAAATPNAYWTAGAGAADPVTGPFDALGRLTTEKWDAGAVTKGRAYLPGSNLSSGFSTTLTGSGTNVYSVQSMTWQGTLLAGYNVTSNWEGAGTAYAAAYDADAHLQEWNATNVGTTGPATQQFNEGYAFSLENLKSDKVAWGAAGEEGVDETCVICPVASRAPGKATVQP